jgi:hypothetical protein
MQPLTPKSVSTGIRKGWPLGLLYPHFSQIRRFSDIIRPQEARIPVPDARFEWLCDTYKPVSRVPAFLTCIDIAGLTAVRPIFVAHNSIH